MDLKNIKVNKIKLALHLISSYINIEEELEIRKALKESEFSDGDDMDDLTEWDESMIINESENFDNNLKPLLEGNVVPLYQHRGFSTCLDEPVWFGKSKPLLEHRGKPDPEKAREREDAHKRGMQRSRNAELLRKAEEARKCKSSKASDEEDSDQHQQSNKQQQRNQQSEISKQEKSLASKAINKAKKFNKVLSNTVKTMVNSAPTSESKKHAKQLSKDVQDINKGLTNSALSKLTPEALKLRKKREREDAENKYDHIEDEYMKKMKTPEERLWFKKNFSKLKRVGVGTVDNVCDMMGYKAIYSDVANATKFLFGKE